MCRNFVETIPAFKAELMPFENIWGTSFSDTHLPFYRGDDNETFAAYWRSCLKVFRE